MYVVLDKSYLDGSSAKELQELATTAQLLVPAALFHELLTTSRESRVRCFSKLPQSINPVALIERIGNLAGLEIKSCTPAGIPSNHILQFDFRFNPGLCNLDYVLPEESRAAVEEEVLYVDQSIDDLVELSDTIPSLFPDLLAGSTEKRQESLRNAHTLIRDAAKVADFLSQLESPDPNHPFPKIAGNAEQWAMIAWLQVRLMLVSDLYVRYQGGLADVMTPAIRTRIEHDVHDAEILALGILQGALATKDNKLRRWFRLLRPGGVLYPDGA